MQPQTTTDIASVRSNLLTRIGLAAIGMKLMEMGARTPEAATQAKEYRSEVESLIATVNQATDIATLRQCEAALLALTAKGKQLS